MVTTMPFGRYAGQPLPDVDSGYLQWFLSACRLSTGLRTAIAGELGRRNIPTAPPPAKPLPACQRCGGAELLVRWQGTGNPDAARPGRAIRATCAACRHFVGWLPQTEENVARAAAAVPAGLFDALGVP
jgi:hypothetical protein